MPSADQVSEPSFLACNNHVAFGSPTRYRHLLLEIKPCHMAFFHMFGPLKVYLVRHPNCFLHFIKIHSIWIHLPSRFAWNGMNFHIVLGWTSHLTRSQPQLRAQNISSVCPHHQLPHPLLAPDFCHAPSSCYCQEAPVTRLSAARRLSCLSLWRTLRPDFQWSNVSVVKSIQWRKGNIWYQDPPWLWS